MNEAKPFFGGKLNIIQAMEVKPGMVINTPVGFRTVSELIPDDDRAGRLIYYRCIDNSMWCSDIDGEVEVKAEIPAAPSVSETRKILDEVTQRKQPAYIPQPGEVHVPRDFEKKRPKTRPKVSPTIDLHRLAPPSEQGGMPQVGGRVRFPGRKRATVIHDPLVDQVKREVEKYLGDVVENPDDEADASEQAWTLAIDAAQDIGIYGERAQRVAKDVCRLLGYPR